MGVDNPAGRSFAVVDVEGNGQSPPDIVEIAVVPIDNGAIGFPNTWMVRPPRPISPGVTRVAHGITNADVAAKPAWAEIAHEVASALSGRVVVAHNAIVEYQVLRAHLPEWEPRQVLDTLKLARKVWPDLNKHSLDDLVLARNIRVPDGTGTRHRALYDAYATAYLFLDLAKAVGTAYDLEDIGGLLPKTKPTNADTLW